MYNTASEELSRELYALTDWDNTNLFSDGSVWFTQDNLEAGDVDINDPDDNLTPMYELGYLLRKLPEAATVSKASKTYGAWIAGVTDIEHALENPTFQEADTPEDALCKLAIELFKQGILK